MARILTDGAESGDLSIFSVTTGMSISSTHHTGNFSYHVGQSGNQSISIVGVSEFYYRAWYLTQYRTSSNNRLLRWSSDSTELGSIRFDTVTNQILLYTGTGTLVATSTASVSASDWFMLEVHVMIANSGGIIEVKINGLSDPTGVFTGDTQPGTQTTINNLGFVGVTGGFTFYFDDIAINDTTGSTDNSWCGDGRVIALTPNANGDSSDLVGNDGNSTDNYLLVDEAPSDGDTTYVESDVPNAKDLYNLTPCGLTNVNIQRVWVEAVAEDTTSGDGVVKLLMKTGSTEYESDDIALGSAYAKQKSSEYLTNPNTSSAWTTSQLDSLQVGMKVIS